MEEKVDLLGNQLALSHKEQLLLLRERMCESYFQARTEYEYLDTQATEAKKRMDSVARQLADLIKEIGDDHFFKDGIRVGTRDHFGISVTQENSDSWRLWLSENFGDDAPFIKEVVDKATLTERIRSDIKTGNLAYEKIPDWASLKIDPIVTLTGWKKQ